MSWDSGVMRNRTDLKVCNGRQDRQLAVSWSTCQQEFTRNSTSDNGSSSSTNMEQVTTEIDVIRNGLAVKEAEGVNQLQMDINTQDPSKTATCNISSNSLGSSGNP